ncbi:Chloramphenicol acetyltransferase 2 [compost metagenome]
MQFIDFETWERRDHFRLYHAMEYPYFGITVDLDVTGLLASLKAAGLPVYSTLIHAVTCVASEIPEFRTRVRGEQLVLHDRLTPSFTVPWRGDLFNFCTVDFDPDRDRFVRASQEAMAVAQDADALILDAPDRDDLIFMTCFPWMAFTGVTHPVNPRGGDAFPRFAWGKITSREGRELLPFNIQLHHGLADGAHAARFLERLENVLKSELTQNVPSDRSRSWV